MPGEKLGGELPRVLVVDNYDSYTFNLVQLLAQRIRHHYGCSEAVQRRLMVIRNDQYPWAVVQERILPFVDCVVVSPGPGSPEHAGDFGICGELIRTTDRRPLLGVCLGHQGIAHAFGAKIVRCAAPVHGQTSPIEVCEAQTDGRPGLFDRIGSGFHAVRYHSLAVSDDGFPHGELQILARATGSVHAFVDGVRCLVPTDEIMALRHRTRPLYGVQFHPESICSERGARIIDNFLAIARGCAAPATNRGHVPCIPPDAAAMSLRALDDRVWHAAEASVAGPAPRFELVDA
ncbi:para-aminobenzoate synthase, (PABA), partial [Coemansia nantahalensis]